MAGDKGVEPLQTRSQSPARYHYANPQYMDRRAGIEPAMFHNLAGIEPDGQLSHSTILVYLRIYKALKSVALPAKQYPGNS